MSKIIDIVAPASHCSHDELMASIEWLEKEGFTPRISQDIIKPELFFASNLKNQLAGMKKALYAKDSDFVWSLRGGYGSMRLLPEMNQWKKPAKEKIFLGFSDNTSMHLFFTQKWNWKSYHGPNFSGINRKDNFAQDLKEVVHLLHGEAFHPDFEGLTPLNKAAEKKKTISGKITGGNLKVVQSMIGTKNEIKSKERILFFEDVGERGYAIHRMLEQMEQSGLLKGVKAILLGDFTEGLEKDGMDRKTPALQMFFEKSKIPVLKGIPAGHDKLNRVVPFNVKCSLKTGKDGILSFN